MDAAVGLLKLSTTQNYLYKINKNPETCIYQFIGYAPGGVVSSTSKSIDQNTIIINLDNSSTWRNTLCNTNTYNYALIDRQLYIHRLYDGVISTNMITGDLELPSSSHIDDAFRHPFKIKIKFEIKYNDNYVVFKEYSEIINKSIDITFDIISILTTYNLDVYTSNAACKLEFNYSIIHISSLDEHDTIMNKILMFNCNNNNKYKIYFHRIGTLFLNSHDDNSYYFIFFTLMLNNLRCAFILSINDFNHFMMVILPQQQTIISCLLYTSPSPRDS